MRGNNILGLVFPNAWDEVLPELTKKRTMGSVPFGGKYRLIDFVLSNMVNSGINKVGVLTKQNFYSLMDHMGSGKAWDLSRRHGGLTILPPFIQGGGKYETPIENMYAIRGYIIDSSEDYVILCDCHSVLNIDYQKLFATHIKNKNDITVVYRKDKLPNDVVNPVLLDLDEEGAVTNIKLNEKEDGICNFIIGSTILRRDLLLELINDCIKNNTVDFEENILKDNLGKLKIGGFEFKGYSFIINSLAGYFRANMALMNPDVRNELFSRSRPIYTKVRDDMPCKYGLGSRVENSLIAQGCVIEGEVVNSVISKGVHIAKGAKVSDCVIMQDSYIGENTTLSYIISDKDVIIKEGRSLTGAKDDPVYITKASKL